MSMNSTEDEDFELQPTEAKRRAPQHAPVESAPRGPIAPDHPTAPPPYLAPSADEPPPKEKVDFENLPEFVWQRKMLRNVRIGALIAFVILIVVLCVFFFGAGKGAKDSLKNVMDGEQPAPETKP